MQDALRCLHGKGLISDPGSKASSLVLTDADLLRATAACYGLLEFAGRAARDAGLTAAADPEQLLRLAAPDDVALDRL